MKKLECHKLKFRARSPVQVALKKINGSEIYKKTVSHRLTQGSSSYLLLKGVHFEILNKKELKGTAKVDLNLIDLKSGEIIFSEKDKVCCDKKQFYECRFVRDALFSCNRGLTADLNVEWL